MVTVRDEWAKPKDEFDAPCDASDPFRCVGDSDVILPEWTNRFIVHTTPNAATIGCTKGTDWVSVHC